MTEHPMRPTLSERELNNADFRAGFLHALVFGTDWPDQVRLNLHAVLMHSLNRETREAYKSAAEESSG